MIFTRKVNYYETDKMGITHHSNYVRFMEEARIYFLDQIGWGYAKMEEDGLSSPVISISCNYKKTTTFADEIEIDVFVKNISAAKLILGYTFRVKDEVVFTAESSHCFFGKDGSIMILKKGMPEFYEKLMELQVTE